jgi:hypothetical protein
MNSLVFQAIVSKATSLHENINLNFDTYNIDKKDFKSQYPNLSIYLNDCQTYDQVNKSI